MLGPKDGTVGSGKNPVAPKIGKYFSSFNTVFVFSCRKRRKGAVFSGQESSGDFLLGDFVGDLFECSAHFQAKNPAFF